MSENLVHFEGSLDELKAKIAAAPGLIVIKFGSTTCMPCKRLNQMLPNIAKENTDVQFLMVDIDDKEDFRNAYEISSVPTVLYYKGNQKLDEIIGLKIPDLKAKIAQYK
ncbi:Thioredoxin family protein [Trichomonas vaginalis G3]|uniref:Thioredoxin family protein n=1 Tax=Trichomonas vaginalis (strain ATCC PRA-98 / G3) TaxID=412133 RepID=A2D796_TRIV3|nr:cell redox homeostasis [Trichomonas vaginalis G3]EAY23613.1 Thioredoxin family protein [Trichomonas vaginalis G3]KAI5490106.1 cell redox homeostasis [Trichomonas vaginalis G3]|eukprot:XP_001276861.1 Thioredoxin family protein [Trichomonas vaginalis G3]